MIDDKGIVFKKIDVVRFLHCFGGGAVNHFQQNLGRQTGIAAGA